MHGDKWWGYLHTNGVVTISPQDPRLFHDRRTHDNTHYTAVTKVVGPFAEDMADEFEGDQKMVRRRIIAAIYNKPLDEVEQHG